MRDACLSERFPTHLKDRNEAIIALLYDAGLRASELVGLNIEHLDLDAGTVYLPSTIQKGAPPPATLQLEPETVRLLQRYLRDRWRDPEAVFPSQSSSRLTARSLQRVVKAVAVEAGVEPQLAEGGTGDSEDVTPHTLRHSLAYRIIQVKEGRLEDVPLRLRHATLQTTDEVDAHLIPR